MFQHLREYIYQEWKQNVKKGISIGYFQSNQFLDNFAFHKIFQCKDEKENSIYRRKPSPREAFENIAQIKVNVRNQMVVKSSQNWKI